MGNSFFDFQQRMAAARRPGAVAGGGSAPGVTARPSAVPLTVSKLTKQIEQVLRGGMPASVLVKGEVSNYKSHGSSGHTYFTLKEKDACLDCVMWKDDAARLKFKPAVGMEIIAG